MINKLEELLPCPFCGGKAVLKPYANPKYLYAIKCESCGCWISYFTGTNQGGANLSKKQEQEYAFKNQDSMVKAWNQRTKKEPAAQER